MTNPEHAPSRVIAGAAIAGIGIGGGAVAFEAVTGFANVDHAAAAAFAAPKVGRVLEQNNALISNQLSEGVSGVPFNVLSNEAHAAQMDSTVLNPSEPSGMETALSSTAEQSTTAETSLQDCADKELVIPEMDKIEIYSPGKSGQTTNVAMNVGDAPAECRGVVDRLFQYEVIVKRSILIHDKLRRITVRLARFNGNYFNRDEGGPFGGSFVANPHNSRELVKCSPGRANTTARFKLRGVITNSATDQEVDRHIWQEPVNIRRKKPC